MFERKPLYGIKTDSNGKVAYVEVIFIDMHVNTIQAKLMKSRKIKTFGFSMFPLLHDQDVIYLKKTKFNQIRVNDIITIQKNKVLLTHRVIYYNKSQKYLITKGDNNLKSDGKINPLQIKGIIYKIKRSGQFFTPNDIYLLQSTIYFQEIIKISKALERNKIDFVFLKGLPLMLYIYGAHPKRIYADCDVLIKSKNINQVEKILKGLGFKKTVGVIAKNRLKASNINPEISFYKYINGWPVVFDIHTSVFFLYNQAGNLSTLFHQKLIDSFARELLLNKQMVQIQNNELPLLSLTSLVVYLLLHYYHHNFIGAFRLRLIAEIINKNRNKIQWNDLIRIIKNHQFEGFIYPGFFLLTKYYGIIVPPDFLFSIAPNNSVQGYIKKDVLRRNIFDDASNMQVRIRRFKDLFFLSPQPLFKRLLILLNLQFIFSLFFAFRWKLFSSFLSQKETQ